MQQHKNKLNETINACTLLRVKNRKNEAIIFNFVLLPARLNFFLLILSLRAYIRLLLTRKSFNKSFP